VQANDVPAIAQNLTVGRNVAKIMQILAAIEACRIRQYGKHQYSDDCPNDYRHLPRQ
jgi:hypothetical protein